MTARTYRGWAVYNDPPPIPVRNFDWHGVSPDFDVDCDQDGFFPCAGQQVHASTYEQLTAEIDAAIEELNDD